MLDPAVVPVELEDSHTYQFSLMKSCLPTYFVIDENVQ